MSKINELQRDLDKIVDQVKYYKEREQEITRKVDDLIHRQDHLENEILKERRRMCIHGDMMAGLINQISLVHTDEIPTGGLTRMIRDGRFNRVNPNAPYRAGETWTDEDNRALQNGFEIFVSAMARVLHRNLGGVTSRIEQNIKSLRYGDYGG